jgi:hypothetical protein
MGWGRGEVVRVAVSKAGEMEGAGCAEDAEARREGPAEAFALGRKRVVNIVRCAEGTTG